MKTMRCVYTVHILNFLVLGIFADMAEEEDYPKMFLRLDTRWGESFLTSRGYPDIYITDFDKSGWRFNPESPKLQIPTTIRSPQNEYICSKADGSGEIELLESERGTCNWMFTFYPKSITRYYIKEANEPHHCLGTENKTYKEEALGKFHVTVAECGKAKFDVWMIEH